MRMDMSDDDAIRAIIDRQFASLNWSPGTAGDWNAFTADFAPDAALYPSARPAMRQTPEDFVTRMKGLAAGPLRAFAEAVLGYSIQVCRTVAVATAAEQITCNDSGGSRD